MKKISFIIMALSLVVVTGSVARGEKSSGDKLVLRLNLEPNANYLSTTDMNQSVTQKFGDKEQNMNQELLMTWQYDVLSKDSSGGYGIRLTYKRVKTSQDFGQRKLNYDSDDPPTSLDPSMKAMASLVGDQLTMRISPGGKVTELEGISQMQEKMIEAMEIPDSVQRNVYLNDLKKQFGEDAIRQSIEQMTDFYPSKSVRIGDTWKTGMDRSAGMPMRIESNYTLISRTDGVDSIDVSCQIKNNPESNSVNMGNMTMTYDIDGDQTGSILVDESTGLPIESNLSLNFAGNIKMSGIPNQDAQTWPISATGTVNVTFEKIASQ